MTGVAAVIRFKFANMSRETEALQSWIEVSHVKAAMLTMRLTMEMLSSRV